MDFVVVHLGSQIKQVQKKVSGWSKQDILKWLAQFGEVEKIVFPGHPNQNLYTFYSVSCRGTTFQLEEDGILVVISGF